MDFPVNRRAFIRNSLASLAAMHFFPMKGLAQLAPAAAAINAPNPYPLINVPSASTSDYTGDEFDRAHEALWDKEGYLSARGGIPAPSIAADTVVVGGGMSGLISAYFLRDRKPIILEQASRFGGNSKGEIFGGSPFSIGAAYISTPEPQSKSAQLLSELGMIPMGRPETDTSVIAQGRPVPKFWEGAAAPGYENQFKTFYSQLRQIAAQSYPEIPYRSDPQGWDRQSFKDWVVHRFGSIHPLLAEFLELYCESSFAATASEVSAYQALNFLSADIAGIVAFPGGNSMITQKLVDRLRAALPPGNLQSGALVIDIAPNAQGVQICFEDASRKLRTIQARNCVYAAPKFTAEKVIRGIPAPQVQAIEQIEYRAYVVGNIILKKPLNPPAYDVFSLLGAPPQEPTAMHPSDRAFTDVCFANWAYPSATTPAVLTAYKAYPYQGARQFLFSPTSHAKHQQAFAAEAAKILPLIGMNAGDIAGVRVTRWGHAIPVAARGLLSSGALDRASAPIANRIFFANQDCFANPSFESALESSWRATQLARR
jgi:protoporphyrinogen oxidase